MTSNEYEKTPDFDHDVVLSNGYGANEMGKKGAKRNASVEARRVAVGVRHLVLHEAGYKCANPRCRYPLTLDVHHMYYVSNGGSNQADNLLPLCPTCHAEHHNGKIPAESLRAWKMLLLALNEAFDRRSIDLLLTIDQLGCVDWITGDGLSAYAGLVASNLIEVKSTPHDSGGKTFRFLYRARLTDKGRLFLDGWKNGDQKAAIQLGGATE